MTHVVVTRAEAESERLSDALAADGYSAIKLPLIAIEPLSGTAEMLDQVRGASAYLFTSANAVKFGLPSLKECLEIGEALVIAVGRKTQDVLGSKGIKADRPEREDSEGILELLKRYELPDGVVIVKGDGGRDLLISTLQDRGVRVVEMKCYRRVWPRVAASDVKAALGTEEKRVIHLASGETLQRLDQLCVENNLDVRHLHTVVVPSVRVEIEARELGWQSRIVSSGAGDEALLNALSDLL